MIPNTLLDTDVLCVYGANPLAVREELKEWLNEKEGRTLLFLVEESDPEALQLSLEPIDKVRIFVVSEELDQERLKQILWEFVFLKIAYFAAPSSETRAHQLFSEIERLISGIHLVASDYRDFGMKVLDNVCSNLQRLPDSRSGRKLSGHFNGIPALICGAGPSLTKNIELIRRLTGSALLFAGGSSLNVFHKHNLTPHFAAAIDPDPPRERMTLQGAFRSPFFYQSRVAKELLAQLEAPLLWMGDSGGYPLERYLQGACGIEESFFDGGWNVVTFCTALTVLMGCDPIIFVGVDLSSPGGALYAEGVDEKTEGLLSTTDVQGNRVFTRRDWLMAKEWLEAFSRQHPDRTFIQTSPGGLTLHGFHRLPLEMVVEKYGQKTQDLYGLVQESVKSLPLFNVNKEKVDEVLSHVQESMRRCEERTDTLLSLFEREFPRLPYESGEGALAEVELEEELAFREILEPLWKIWQPIWTRNALHMSSLEIENTLQKLLFLKKVAHEQRKKTDILS